jgi:hypothetical protein
MIVFRKSAFVCRMDQILRELSLAGLEGIADKPSGPKEELSENILILFTGSVKK